jgi:hypothetical protein
VFFPAVEINISLAKTPRPLIHGLTFLNMASNSERKSTMKSPIFVTAVSMTVTKTISSEPPYFLCESFRYSEGHFAYVFFSIDIPFEGKRKQFKRIFYFELVIFKLQCAESWA